MRIEIEVPEYVLEAFDIARKGEGPVEYEKRVVVRNVGMLGWESLMAKHKAMVASVIASFTADGATEGGAEQ